MALQAVEMTRAGHQVHVISLAGPVDGPVTDQLKDGSIPVTYVPTGGRYSLLDPARTKRLSQVISTIDPDVVHLHLDTAIIVGSRAARSRGWPVAVTLHGSAPDFRRLAGLKRPLLNRALRQADRVIAVGPQVAETWRSAVPGLDPSVVVNPVTNIGPAVDRQNQLGTAGGRLEIMAVGRLVHQKSYEVLVEAMRIVVDAEPAVRCRIAGEGPERPLIEAAISQHGLDGHVELLGSRTDVDSLLAEADLFVSSSSSEGLPVSVLEAMASSLPVVCTDVGDVRAAVPEPAGLVVRANAPDELARAMLTMINDHDRRLSCGKAGRQHVETHHDPARWATGLAEIYSELTGGLS